MHHLFAVECIHREGIVNADDSLELGNSTASLLSVFYIPHTVSRAADFSD